MDVDEAIGTLSELRDDKATDLTTNECQAIGIALVVLIALEPSQHKMIDALLAEPNASSN